MHEFTGVLEKYEDNLYNYHIKVPPNIVEDLRAKKVKRLICHINNGDAIHSSLIPAGDNVYFLKINKDLREQYSLRVGTKAQIRITEDRTTYGMPMPEELQELMTVDPEGDRYFHQLPPGKQRNLLFIINKLKSTDKRIEKSIIIIEHLKEQLGNLDFKQLNEDFKNKKRLG